MIGGYASNSGFIIYDPDLEITIKSKGFQDNLKNKDRKKIIINIFRWILIISFATFLVKTLPFAFWTSLIVGILGGLVAIPFIDLIIKFFWALILMRKNNFREYHACEHKALHLLEELELNMINLGETKAMYPKLFAEMVEKKLTIENLQKMPSAKRGCGTGLEFLQRHFTTKEPSHEKLEEALEVARKYCGMIS